jgi:tetratricopeptide (TPR) repeat protein
LKKINSEITALNKEGKHQQVIDTLTPAILSSNQNSDLYYESGLAYYVTGVIDKALTRFNKAIALDPGNLPYYIMRGSIRMNEGDYKNAIADFDQAVEMDPDEELAKEFKVEAERQLN